MTATIDVPRTLQTSEVRVCNCRSCGSQLIGRQTVEDVADGLYRLPWNYRQVPIAVRIDCIPYCPACALGRLQG